MNTAIEMESTTLKFLIASDESEGFEGFANDDEDLVDAVGDDEAEDDDETDGEGDEEEDDDEEEEAV